jgi:hypothetical protein
VWTQTSKDGPHNDLQRETRSLSHKACLVAGRPLIDALDDDVCSSMVKGASVKLLHVIAHKIGRTQLCGEFGDTFTNNKRHVQQQVKILARRWKVQSSSQRRHCMDQEGGPLSLGTPNVGSGSKKMVIAVTKHVDTHVNNFMMVG